MKWIGLISGVAGLLLISSRAGFVLLIYVCPVSVGALPTSREPPPAWCDGQSRLHCPEPILWCYQAEAQQQMNDMAASAPREVTSHRY